MYGVVNANYGKFARHRSFAYFITELFQVKELQIKFHAFDSCKPDFEIIKGELLPVFREKNKGYGCFLGYSLE